MVVPIIGAFFFLSMPLSVAGKIQRGLQQGFLDNIWSGIGTLLSLMLVYAAVRLDSGVIGCILGFLCGQLFAAVFNNIHYFIVKRIDLRPTIRSINADIAKQIFAIGGMFFVLQVTASIQSQIDTLLIAALLGSTSVTTYAICMKMFAAVTTLITLTMLPLWPAYSEAFGSRDIDWIKATFLKSFFVSAGLSIPMALIIVAYGEQIARLWVGPTIEIPQALLIGCAVWMVLSSVGSAIASLFSGLQLIKVQVVCALLTGSVNVLLSFFFIKSFGLSGAVYGSIIAWAVFTLAPYTYLIVRMYRVPTESWRG
jgi:O-antigen/teichoic acid export membrane protein